MDLRLLHQAPRFLAGMAAATLLMAGCRTSYSDDGGGSIDLDVDTVAAEEAAAGLTEPGVEGPERISMAFPTGDRSTSAVLLEKEIPAEVIKGQPFEYLLVVQNLTDRDLENVRLTDTVPAGLSVESREPVANVAGDLATWDLGTLAARATKTVKVQAIANTLEDFETCATVEYESRLCAMVRVIAPALDIVITAPEEGLSSDPFEVTVTVTNTGSGDAKGVRVVEELPEGLTTLSGQSRIVMDFGTLEGGQSESKSVRLRAAQGGAFTQTATAEASSGLSATATPVTTMLREPQLSIRMTGDAEVRAGRPYAAQVVLSNTGDGISEETALLVNLPQGVRAVTFTEGGKDTASGITWEVGSLAPGESRVFDMRLRAPEEGVLVTEAVASSRSSNEQAATLRTELAGLAALGLSVSDESDLIPVGEDVTYLIVVENEGSADDTNIAVSAVIEEGIEVVQADGDSSTTVEGNTIRFDTIPVLTPGQTVELRVTVRSTVELDSRFQVSVVSDTKTRPISQTESTDFFQ